MPATGGEHGEYLEHHQRRIVFLHGPFEQGHAGLEVAERGVRLGEDTRLHVTG